MKALKAIPQHEFQKNVSNSVRQRRWAKCIAAQGGCCEGDPPQ